MRRALAVVTLLGVLLSPLAVLWCTCACEADDAAPAVARLAAGTAAPVLAAEDDCPSGGIATALTAVMGQRAAQPRLTSLPISFALPMLVPGRQTAARPEPAASSQSPPGSASFSVLRI